MPDPRVAELRDISRRLRELATEIPDASFKRRVAAAALSLAEVAEAVSRQESSG